VSKVQPDLDGFSGTLPLFPLPNVVLFPHTNLPLHIFEPRYREMLRDARAGAGLIGMVRFCPLLPRDANGAPVLPEIGCVGRITDVVDLPDGRSNLTLVGLSRFRIMEEVPGGPYRSARVTWVPDLNDDDGGGRAEATFGRLARLAGENARARGEAPPFETPTLPDSGLGAVVNLLVRESRIEPGEMQALLEIGDVYARARRLENLLRRRRDARLRTEGQRGFLPDDPGKN
jgi:Lon protease-like protein